MSSRLTPAAADFLAEETLRLIGPDPANWVPEREGVDHNVVVVGGGHTGTALAFALRRAGIGQVSVIDRSADEAGSGIWRTIARMTQLRTPKNLVGPELGHAGLGFQAWYEARHGREAYAALPAIPRLAWADYISWYRRTLGIAIRYRTELVRIAPAGDHFRLHLTVDGAPRVETTRKVILANGFGGSGGAYVPDMLKALPATHLAHTTAAIDFPALKGRTVAVIGAAASAFDAAATALEAGAQAVHLFSRRPELSATAVNKTRAYPGAYDNFHDFPDALRWALAARYRRLGTTAPQDTVERAIRHPNFRIHLNARWPVPEIADGKVSVKLGGETHAFDFVIAGTGYVVDLGQRPELADFADRIALWQDRYQPPPDARDAVLARHPYLGRALEFQEKTPGLAPYLSNIHAFNPGAFVTSGLPVGDVPSFRREIPAVVAGISRDLFLADLALHEQKITAPVAPDFGLSLYGGAVHRAPALAAE
ncbi:NAD(P)-binding domain-containing protein [Azorhizobium doebereinerae]|uniref:NAD(P)-binding domain-containing protein n=1 Tax=Azorhizobium doebereinerae TaxID=281091 RepID=UPI00042940DE|nr:NAD(P)-binding domain-containing protein [Azorhizobium doebereinerae]